MFSGETKSLLHKNLPALPHMLCSRSLKHDIDELAAMALPVKRLAIIDDRNTAQAFGDQVLRALKGRFDCVHVTLESPAVADSEAVAHVRQKTAACDALVAVGSGAISDICKYASFQDGKPYLVFPTAASMNGYLSANASITVDGTKKTLAAHMPQAVFCDMSVIAAAPLRLSKSGLGDSLARSTAQADWLLSHLLLATAYSETPFALLKPLEPQLHDNARGIGMGDAASIELLMQILLLSGLGMTIAGGSYPASQGEHMIAHAMEMVVASGKWQVASKEKTNLATYHLPLATYHGEQIGVTTLTMARMQENLLKKRLALKPVDFPSEAMTALFGSQVTEEAKKAYSIKQEKLDSRRHGKDKGWEAAVERIEPVVIPAAKIHGILKAAECPYTPEALGWSHENYENTINYSRFLRDRFTFLDLQ